MYRECYAFKLRWSSWFQPYKFGVGFFGGNFINRYLDSSLLYYRELEEDYIAHASTVGQRALSVEAEKPEVHLCPICLKNELSVDDPPGVRSGQNICNDCGVLTCSECGAFQGSMTSKVHVDGLC